MGQAVVVLKKGEGRTLKSGGAWVYDNEIASVTGSYEDGDMVIVRDFDGYPMGRGFINRHSKIRVRLMTRHVDQEIDRDFLRERLQAAWDYRKKVTDVSSCRLVFGEADFLPGLVVDKFSDVLVVQVTALGMDRMKLDIVDLLKEILLEDVSLSGGSTREAMANTVTRRGWNVSKSLLVSLLTPTFRLLRMVSVISLMLRTDRRQAFSWIRSIIVCLFRDCVRAPECLTALHIQALLH